MTPAGPGGPLENAGVKRLIKAAGDYVTALVEERKAAQEARQAATQRAIESKAAQENETPPDDLPFRDRAKVIADCDLGPHSLVGSYFLAIEEGDAVLMGLVVGEPQPPVQPVSNYLVQVYDGVLGTKKKQLLIPVSRMLGEASEQDDRMGIGHDRQVEWSFYDTEDELKEAWYAYCNSKAREGVRGGS